MEMSNQLHNPADLSRGKKRPVSLIIVSRMDVQGSRGMMSGTVLAFVWGRRRIKMKRINQALANPDTEVRSIGRYTLT